jgi:nucleoside-diphosphate-sugar epimerase
LITGGIGWVPSHIVKAIAAAGEQVISYDLMEPDTLFDELLGEHRSLVTIEHGDVTDSARLFEVARKHSIDAIIHAAAITPRRDRERREPARIVDVNLGGTINALDAARALPNFRRFVYISSGAALGNVAHLPEVNEETPSRAVSLYGITKHTSERVLSRHRELFELDAVSVRLANVYGPMERITPGYVGATELREMLRIHFEGQQVRINSLEGPWLDWTYVSDIADGIRRAWQKPSLAHDLYTLTCGKLYSMGDVLREFERNLPGFRYERVDRDQANYLVSGDVGGTAPSNERYREEFGWTPDTSFTDGMSRYLSWIQHHGPQ